MTGQRRPSKLAQINIDYFVGDGTQASCNPPRRH
jgi:hypothetical protein